MYVILLKFYIKLYKYAYASKIYSYYSSHPSSRKPKPPVNTFMKNWLSQPKKEPTDGNVTSKSPVKSPSKKSSPNKQSKSTSLMMNWLTKGKREPDENDCSSIKKFKVDN